MKKTDRVRIYGVDGHTGEPSGDHSDGTVQAVSAGRAEVKWDDNTFSRHAVAELTPLMVLTRFDVNNYDLAIVTNTKGEGRRKAIAAMKNDYPSVYTSATAAFDDMGWQHEFVLGEVIWP